MTPADESAARHPRGGTYDGQPCTCTRQCPAVCDGACGCEACLRAWFDSQLDDLVGASWTSTGSSS